MTPAIQKVKSRFDAKEMLGRFGFQKFEEPCPQKSFPRMLLTREVN